MAIGLVVALLVVAGLGYGYFRYEWSKVSSSPCSSCVAAANGQPYNVLLIGSDSRAGETAAEAQQFGNATNAGGQRSDTIKIVHVDPAAGTASTLSIPRDTYVTLSGLPANTQLASANKINAAFSGGPDALIKTIQNTFGIPISHYIEISFFGLQDAVNALGGVSMDFPYPVRDQDCSTGVCYNNSGLNIPTAGCQVLNGPQALALSRSRYFQYYANGEWNSDPTARHRPHRAPEPDHLGRPGQGQVDLQPVPAQLLAHLGGPRLQQGQRPHPQRSLRPGRALPRLLRFRAPGLHAADGRGLLVGGRRRRGRPARCRAPR